jgi:hypothetical protein
MRPWTAAHLGTSVTGEWEADVNWDQDVINNLTPPLDLPDRDGADDGVLFPLTLAHCRSNVMLYTYRVVAPVVSVMFVNVWFDWNRDGDWDDTMVCGNGSAAPEWVVQNQLVFLTAPGLYTNSTPGFRAWHPAAGNQPGWMRITFSETMVPGPLGFNGRGGDGPKVGYQYGETEDYYVTAYAENGELDFSDAPDPTYPTMLPAGARHQIVPGFQLGPLVDAETNGLPHPQALGDDSSNLPDEDGVQIRAPWLTGTQACVNVSLISGPLGGRLDAWLDFNRNGSWDGGEQIFANAPLVPGVNPLCFAIPCNASLGTNFARFRLTSNGGVGPGGAARDGEVEDYLVFIQQPRPTNSVSITNITVTNLVVSGTNYQVASLWWNAQSCIQYQLEQTLSLGTNGGTNIAWTPAGSVVIGPANSQTVTNLAQPATQRYYRIVVP